MKMFVLDIILESIKTLKYAPNTQSTGVSGRGIVGQGAAVWLP
jgi:hypothetical protein